MNNFQGFHIIRVHAKQLAGGEEEEEEKNLGGYSCDVCGKQVKTMDILKRHQLLHLAKKPTFKCKKCGKVSSYFNFNYLCHVKMYVMCLVFIMSRPILNIVNVALMA
jgi:hypothetical protein